MRSFGVSCLVVLAILGACGFSQTKTSTLGSTASNQIRVALASGHPVMLVVQPSGRSDDSEAYSDWAEYLNAFARQERSVNIVKLSDRSYSELIRSPRLNKPYNTLFLRDATHALLYRGMILEPDVYAKGKAYMLGKATPHSVKDTGLEEVKLNVQP